MVFVSPRALAVSALALTCSTVLAETPQCNTMATDGYYHIVNVHSSKPISMDPDTKNIYQGTTATDFQLIPTSDGFYRIVSKSGFDMTSEARSHSDGANVIGEPLEPGNQLFEWCFTTRGTDGYEIYNRLNTRSLDGTMSGGYNVLQWGWWGGLNQEWRVYPATSDPNPTPTPTPTLPTTPAPTMALPPECDVLPRGKYFKIMNQKSNLPLAVEGGLTIPGANVAQETGEENANWRFELTSDNHYRVVNEKSDLCLATKNGSPDNGASVVQYEAVPDDIKYEWCFKRQTFGYEVRNRYSYKALDATQSGGNDVLVWDYGDGLHQQWGLLYAKDVPSGVTDAPTMAPVAVTKAPTGAPTLPATLPPTPVPTRAPTGAPTLAATLPPTPVPTKAPTPAITPAPTVMPTTAAPTYMPTAAPTTAPTTSPTTTSTTTDGDPYPTPTPTPTLPTTPAPTMALPPECDVLPRGKYFKIMNQKSNLPLAVEGGLTIPGANVAQETGEENANWRFEPTSDNHYRVVNEKSDLCLATKNGSPDNGASVVQYEAVPDDIKYEWCFKRQTFGYEVRNRYSYKALDATQSGGNDVLVWDYGDGLHQQWGLLYAKDVPSGVTDAPTMAPVAVTKAPTGAPTLPATLPPTPVPTRAPTGAPTLAATLPPTPVPTKAPTPAPTKAPTPAITPAPTVMPTTAAPTYMPTAAPTTAPTTSPTTTSTTTDDGFPLCINAGGDEFINEYTGETWQSDEAYADGGAVPPFYADIDIVDGGEDALVYETERYGVFGYKIPTGNGVFTVSFYFAEIFEWYNAPGFRVFSCAAEGIPVISDLDIVGVVGQNFKALKIDVDVTVADGVLDVDFLNFIENPKISGLRIEKK